MKGISRTRKTLAVASNRDYFEGDKIRIENYIDIFHFIYNDEVLVWHNLYIY